MCDDRYSEGYADGSESGYTDGYKDGYDAAIERLISFMNIPEDVLSKVTKVKDT